MKRALSLTAFVLAVLCTGEVVACTTAVISARASRTGRPLLWKQRDAPSKSNHLVHLRGDRYAFTGLVDGDDFRMESVWCGANERGFAIVNNVSYNLRPDSLENKPYEGMVMKQALGSCATVDDFERLLRERPYPNGLETNYGVIDAEGGAASFEVWDYGYTRYDADEAPEGYLFRTNFSLSGRLGEGRGYTRYTTVEELMAASAARKFTPSWLIDSLGRSFRNTVLGTDLLQESLPASGLVTDVDYIPRYTTTASIVIEGVTAGGDCNSTVLWCALGYTPCCYAVPVWVAAGDRIPAMLTASPGAKAPANETSLEFKRHIFPIRRDGGNIYLDMRLLRECILPQVRRAEACEIEAGVKLDRELRSGGFDPRAVDAFNEAASRRFRIYRQNIANLLQP